MRVAVNRKKQIKQKCAKKHCNNPVKKGQKYCSKDCSPYGNMVDSPEIIKKFGFSFEK